MKITRRQLRNLIRESMIHLLEEGSFHDRGETGPDKGILLAGDSQMSGFLGDALESALGVERTWYKWGAPGTVIAKNIKKHAHGATDGAVVNFGDNDWNNPGRNVQAVVSVLKTTPAYQSDPRSIVVIGPPPTFEPSEEGKYISLNEESPYFWENIWHGKRDANETIKSAVESEGMTFINPYSYLSVEEDQPRKTDGVHYGSENANKLVSAISSHLPTGTV